MLFSYEFMPDKIDMLHVFVGHVVLKILCQPLEHEEITSESFHPHFKDMVRDVNNRYILTPIKSAHKICKTLPKKKLQLLEKAFRNNNKISLLCEGLLEPVRYKEIEDISPQLKTCIYTFCVALYDKVLDLAPFKSKYNSLQEHYKRFSSFNTFNRCSACGLTRLLTSDDSISQETLKKEAYDHYFNKGRYPFSSVNFYNLIPMCHNCNSKFKVSTDVIISESNLRRKAFYPFKSYPHIAFYVLFTELNSNGTPKASKILMSCTDFDEEVNTWNSIFNIEDRYIAYFNSDDCMDVLNQYQQIKLHNPSLDYTTLYGGNIYADENFLKIALLNGYKDMGVI